MPVGMPSEAPVCVAGWWLDVDSKQVLETKIERIFAGLPFPIMLVQLVIRTPIYSAVVTISLRSGPPLPC